MKVICAMDGCEVRWLAVSGQQTMGWINSGECPQALSALLAMCPKCCVLHAVFSDAFRTRAEPVKRVEMKGEMKLWNG